MATAAAKKPSLAASCIYGGTQCIGWAAVRISPAVSFKGLGKK
jgi:hypothetical protein